MPVSKRTRYEVLKRDNHTCRYCGRSAPDVKLTVDHVTPVALGGTDKPDNLVAACRDCNAGKASASPDAAVVEDVKQLDAKWAGAIQRVAQARGRQRKKRTAYVMAFLEEWRGYSHGWRDDPFPLADNWRPSVERFYDLGVPTEEIADCVRVALTNSRIHHEDAYRYFAGCVWRIVTEMQEAAKELLDAEGDA